MSKLEDATVYIALIPRDFIVLGLISTVYRRNETDLHKTSFFSVFRISILILIPGTNFTWKTTFTWNTNLKIATLGG